jgi:hypothetical protein
VNEPVVPLPETVVEDVRAAFVAYLKPVAVTGAPPVAVMVALSVAPASPMEVAGSVSIVGTDGGFCKQRMEKPCFGL